MLGSDASNVVKIRSIKYGKSGMFEFINVFPNPSSDGLFTLTFATGDQNDVEISVVNTAGQVMNKMTRAISYPGIHKQVIDTQSYATGVYRMVISSGGKVLSKSVLKK